MQILDQKLRIYVFIFSNVTILLTETNKLFFPDIPFVVRVNFLPFVLRVNFYAVLLPKTNFLNMEKEMYNYNFILFIFYRLSKFISFSLLILLVFLLKFSSF